MPAERIQSELQERRETREHTATEAAMSRIWAEALQRTQDIAYDENFFQAGGDSLAMMMILFRVKEDMGVDLPPAAFMETPSFAAFCAVVDAIRKLDSQTA